MEQLMGVARSLRNEHHFGGYIHLKTIPGSDERIVEQKQDRKAGFKAPPFAPAGQVFDETLAFAHLSRDEIYITDSVKHFHREPQGKRRLHKKPPARPRLLFVLCLCGELYSRTSDGLPP